VQPQADAKSAEDLLHARVMINSLEDQLKLAEATAARRSLELERDARIRDEKAAAVQALRDEEQQLRRNLAVAPKLRRSTSRF
jgi:hypothetical protein